MKCTECQENLVGHQEQLLEGPERAALEEHLSQCPACRSEQAAVAQLHQRLVARGELVASVGMVNRVMTRIRQTETPAKARAAAPGPFWKWLVGLGMAGATAAVALLLFSPGAQLRASEVMSRGITAARQLTSIHLQCRVRTAPADNFAHIDPRNEFVPVELWKELGTVPKWRIEKPGRFAVMDGQSTVLFMRNVNAAYKVPRAARDAFDTRWLHEMAIIETALETELRNAQSRGWKMDVKRESTVSGTAEAVVVIEAKANVPEGDYLKNKFFTTADTRRVYRFDDQSGRLQAVQVYLQESTGETLVFEVDRIDYNQPIPAAVFTAQLPDDVRWIQDRPRSADPQFAKLTAQEAARTFFEACGREDWETVGKFWSLPLDGRLKSYLGGIQIVSLGEAFTSAVSKAKFVPYEIRLRDGGVKKHNLALKQHADIGGWYVDGGL
jgi:hypothetical protein